MAELDTSGGGKHKKGPGVKKSKKLSTRVDLTPMVDLGFLLITFFIFTTTMTHPTAMNLFLPKDTDKPDEQNKAKESGALTIMLGKNDNIFYYEGQMEANGSNMKSATFKTIRDVIIDKKRNTNEKDLVIILKPDDESTYKNVINILDEMLINDIKRYALVNITPQEDTFVKLSEGEPGVQQPAAGGQ